MRSQNVHDDGLRLADVVFIDEATHASMISTATRPGDLLLNITGASLGRTCLVPQDLGEANVNQHVCIVRTDPRVNSRFLRYAVQSHPVRLQVLSSENGASREGLNFQQVAALSFWAPASVDTQRAIADFLDRKTAAIDALIEKKERLIALLEEKRQALITQAVTKGLDPTVPMKDSAIPWLGEIPAHWEVKRLKQLSSRVQVGVVVTPAKYYDDDGTVPAIRSFNVRPGEISPEGLAFISEESNRQLSKSMVREGDLVVVRTGKPGVAAVVPEDLDGANCVDVIIVRRSAAFDSHFVCNVMNSWPSQVQYGSGSEGALQQHFNIETARNMILPAPPVDEQRAISAYLATTKARARRLHQAIEESVDRLHEYRSSLITASVTGALQLAQERSLNV